MWEKLPIFRDSLNKVPTIHLPYKKDLIKMHWRIQILWLIQKEKQKNIKYYAKL